MRPLSSPQTFRQSSQWQLTGRSSLASALPSASATGKPDTYSNQINQFHEHGTAQNGATAATTAAAAEADVHAVQRTGRKMGSSFGPK